MDVVSGHEWIEELDDDGNVVTCFSVSFDVELCRDLPAGLTIKECTEMTYDPEGDGLPTRVDEIPSHDVPARVWQQLEYKYIEGMEIP